MAPQTTQNTEQSKRAQTNEITPAKLSDIVRRIASTLIKYVSLKPGVATLLALWVVLTYVYERFRYAAYVHVHSPLPRCGKTRLMQLIALFVAGETPIVAIPTPAALFRSERRCLIVDEVDHLSNIDQGRYGDLIALLNVGFSRGAKIERVVPDGKGGFSVKQFDVYYPKMFAGLSELTDTLADRTLHVAMSRTHIRMPRLNERRLEGEAETIRTALQQWADRNGESLEATYLNLPDTIPDLEGFDDRFQDISEPLMVLASVADSECSKGPRILPALLLGLKTCSQERVIHPLEQQANVLARAIRPHLRHEQTRFFTSDMLLYFCQHNDELAHLRSGKALAPFLKIFGLSPKKDKTGTKRGYDIGLPWVEAHIIENEE